MQESVEAGSAKILRLCQVKSQLSKTEVGEAVRAAEALRDTFMQQRHNFLRDTGSRAALMHYCSDATGRLTKMSWGTKPGETRRGASG